MPEPRSHDMLPTPLPDAVRAALLAPMVDQHCCGVRRDDTTRSGFEQLIGEGGTPAPPGTTHFDPLNGRVEIAGPEQFWMDEFFQQALTAWGDPR
ncbi:hypothetical protein AB0J07_42770, partial [Microbispora rosea]